MAELDMHASSLAHEFDYRLLFVVHFSDRREEPQIHEVERVAISMSNDAETSMRRGVEEGKLTEADVNVSNFDILCCS
jgi:hypothetical protein